MQCNRVKVVGRERGVSSIVLFFRRLRLFLAPAALARIRGNTEKDHDVIDLYPHHGLIGEQTASSNIICVNDAFPLFVLL